MADGHQKRRLSGLKVVLLEESPEIRSVLVRFLKREGAAIEETSTPHEALLRHTPPDTCLLLGQRHNLYEIIGLNSGSVPKRVVLFADWEIPFELRKDLSGVINKSTGLEALVSSLLLAAQSEGD